MIKIVTIGFVALGKYVKKDQDRYRRNEQKKEGLTAASLLVLAHAKKKYLRGPYNPNASSGVLGKPTGDLAAKATFKVDAKKGQAKVGWFRSVYAGVVAEPSDGRTETTIRPIHGEFLRFPLTKEARNVWHMRGGSEIINEDGNRGLVMGGRTLMQGKDYAIARSVTIRARFPLTKSLNDKSNQITEAMADAFIPLGSK